MMMDLDIKNFKKELRATKLKYKNEQQEWSMNYLESAILNAIRFKTQIRQVEKEKLAHEISHFANNVGIDISYFIYHIIHNMLFNSSCTVLLEIIQCMYVQLLFTIKQKHYFDDMFFNMLEDNEMHKIKYLKKYAPSVFEDIKRSKISAYRFKQLCKYRSEEAIEYVLKNIDITDITDESDIALFNFLNYENSTGFVELFFIASQCHENLFNKIRSSERFCSYILDYMDYMSYEINSDVYKCITSKISKDKVISLLNKWVDSETQTIFQKEVIKYYLND